MGLNITLGPPNIYNNWSDQQWQEYWESHEINPIKIGSWIAISELLETIRLNLEQREYEAVFPTIQRITNEGFMGWNHDEVDNLLMELELIKREFMLLELDKQVKLNILSDNSVTLEYYQDASLEELKNEYSKAYPGKELTNLYHLNHWFLDNLTTYSNQAQQYTNGIFAW